jgi:K+-transporting ATPase ATPase C chain
MKQHIIPAIRLTLFSVLFFCGAYSLLILGIAQLEGNHGNGKKVSVNGHVVGFALVGQKFDQDKYFWSRPSAANYNAAGSAGSNKGPSNPDYLKQVKERMDNFLAHNPGITKEQVPAELVTASGSGLDPDLSPAAATIQIKRIASIRTIEETKLNVLINQMTQKPVLGRPHINVLLLNIELDNLK